MTENIVTEESILKVLRRYYEEYGQRAHIGLGVIAGEFGMNYKDTIRNILEILFTKDKVIREEGNDGKTIFYQFSNSAKTF